MTSRRRLLIGTRTRSYWRGRGRGRRDEQGCRGAHPLGGGEERDPAEVRVAERYEELLRESRLIDFEGMVIGALQAIRANETVRDVLTSQFSWLLVDEYQDLGGPLHQIVIALYETRRIRIF